MKTLIEFYEERAIENVLAPDLFRPERVVYLCPAEIARDKNRQQKIKTFFRRRGWNPEVEFLESSFYSAEKILQQLLSIADRCPECALDITGGTDAALFAGGMFASQRKIPSFTYSRKQNRFFNISGASFVEKVECSLAYRVEDFFLMAGGTMGQGRVDNDRLYDYLDDFDRFFAVYLHHRRKWTDIITYLQKISPGNKGEEPPLEVTGRYTVKGEHGMPNSANEVALRELEKIGFLRDLKIITGESVHFNFRDATIRAWLRDIGSVLELYTYKTCLDTGVFSSVVSSAVVHWDEVRGHAAVSNEIDVVAVRGVVPLFLSCKTCDVRTEAINELAILRDRFGGKTARAAIVTAEPCNAAARHRAAQMGIAVIDLEELDKAHLTQRIKTIMKVAE